MKFVVPVVLIALLLSACTSLVGKGDKLYEAGEYEAAAEFYQRALHKDPNSVEATIGLRRAQEKIVDRGLIDVRMLRLSSNWEAATQKLEQILRNQKLWDLQISGAIAVTQKEETRFARSWLAKEAERLADGTYPDQFRYLESQYAAIIGGSVPLQNALADLRSGVDKKGEKLCRELASQVAGQRFFLKEFAAKYCSHWRTPVSLRVDAIDTTRYERLLVDNSVRYAMDYDNNPVAYFNQLIDGLSEAFRGSIWQAEQARGVLRVNANGEVRYSRYSRRVQRYADYTISKKTKSKNSAGEDVVNIQEIDKIHRYYARVYTEEFAIDVSLQTTVDSKPITRGKNYQDSHQTESHNEDFPLAHLRPQSPSFMDLSSLFKIEISALQNDFLQALNQQWENKYCQTNLGSERGENILRCAAVNPGHAYVNTWFSNKFGLNYQELASLTGVE